MDRLERIPPYSEEAERGLLGALLSPSEDGSSRILWLCSERGLDANAFYLRGHDTLFQAMLDMQTKAIHTDILTVTNWCRDKGILDMVGGAVFLDMLLDACPTPKYAESYADIVLEKYQLRKLIDACRVGLDLAYDPGEAPAAEVIAEAQLGILDLEAKRGQRTHAEVLKEVDQGIVDAHNGAPGGLPCPWEELNKMWGGPANKLVTLLCARKRTGKSTLLGQWAAWLAKKYEMPGMVAPFEDGPNKFYLRMAGLEGGFSAFDATHGRFGSDAQMEWARECLKRVMGFPIHFVDGRCKMADLAAMAIQYKAKYGIEYLMIDALKDIETPGKTNEDDIQLSSQLTALADRLNIPVIVAVHLNKIDEGSLINLNNIRGSSRIADDAKLVLAIQKVQGQYALDVIANNHGPEDSVAVEFKTAPECFQEFPVQQEKQQEEFGV